MQLSDKLETQFRLSPEQKRALARLGLNIVADLLFYFPERYTGQSVLKMIRDLEGGETATVYGEISKLNIRKSFRTKVPMAEAVLDDGTGKLKITWFNQAFIGKMLHDGQRVTLTGKVSSGKYGLSMSNPEYEKGKSLPIDTHDSLFYESGNTKDFSFPVYRETKGITSKWIYHAIEKIIGSGLVSKLVEYIPEEILKKYSLPKLSTALIWIHMPQSDRDAQAARKRFAFEEVFMIQLEKAREREENRTKKSFKISVDTKDINDFTKRFPFEMTAGQTRAISEVFSDFGREYPMSRLLEGDVGSGKTAIAATAAYSVIQNRPPSTTARDKRQDFGNLQVAYMAPTEILANQHFESFIKYFTHTGIQVGLITGASCKKFPSKSNPNEWTNISKAQLLKWVANGEIPILIGTHALIYKSVKFKHLALAIVDEQHRFGVNQRKSLVRRTSAEQTRKNAETTDPIVYRDLTYRIRGALFNVKKELGGGHKEIIYQRAVEEEFKKAGLNFSREVRIPIKYNRKEIGTYVPDFVVDNKIVVELKALPFVGTIEKKQAWGYLKGSEYRLALLVNFGPKELTIDRVVYDKARSASDPDDSASVPHLLSMTATPIPRTLALTIYGDLDLTLLDEMPKGRKQIITEIIMPDKREQTYEFIKSEMKNGRQLYVICPRIDEPDPENEMAIQAKSVVAEAARLKKTIFQDKTIGILHSKMTKTEKESVMEEFSEGRIDILCATSVVEVGVNVPNATMIIIEGAERFGLAQLHQLRGRVIRSNHQAYCFVMPNTESEKSVKRLEALKTAKNGFELSELDLKLRGSGDLAGMKQWGVSDLGMEAIKNMKMVEAARNEAREIITKNLLPKFPLLESEFLRREKKIHFE